MRILVAGIRAFMNHCLNTAPLSDLVVIEASGADSVTFLQSQLTHDVTHLNNVSARLAGYCTPKGRLVASMVVWKTDSIHTPLVHILVKADIAEAFVKRLSMYILRAKVKLRVADSSVRGLSVQQIVSNGVGSLELPRHALPWTVLQSDKGAYIKAPSADSRVDRWWHIPATGDAIAQDGASAADAPGAQHWQAADIAAGLPWIVAATQDVFIPQTLNFDLIDAVSFSKGCYPGQEVVARSHYLGKIKRRMAYGLADKQPDGAASELAGVDIFDANRPAKPCGRVINAAQADQVHLLFEAQLADLGVADFRIGNASGPNIALQPLPYEIKEIS